MAFFQNSDVFDTGSDGSDSERAPSIKEPPRQTSQDDTSAVEQPDTPAPSSRKKAGGRHQRKSQKLKKSELFEVHSESQRMIRESKVLIPKLQPRTRTIDSFLTKVNKTLQSCTQNVVKTMKSTSFSNCDNNFTVESTKEEGMMVICTNSHIEAIAVHEKENTAQGGVGQPKVPAAQGVGQPKVPEPKLSSFAITDFSVPVVMETKELTELDRLKQRFTAQVEQGKRPTQTSAVIAPLSTETQSLIPSDLAAQLKNKPGALRQHLHATLKRQLSQKRAEERKVAEEERKLYGEEAIDDAEEEEELTDQDTTDVDSSSDGEGDGASIVKEKRETPGECSEEKKEKGSEMGEKQEGPNNAGGFTSDGEDEQSDEDGPSDGEQSDEDGPSGGEQNGGDGEDSDDGIGPLSKRNNAVRKQRIDSDDEDVGDLPILKQSASLASSSGENAVPSPRSQRGGAVEHAAPLNVENAAVQMSEVCQAALLGTRECQPTSERTSQGMNDEVDTVGGVDSEEEKEVEVPMDSGLGLSGQEDSCSQLLVDASSSQEKLPHLQTIAEEGSHLQVVSSEVGPDLSAVSEESCSLQLQQQQQVTCSDGTADASLSSFPPAQRVHSPPDFKVSMASRKDSIVSYHSDQKLFETQTTDGSQDLSDTENSAQAWPDSNTLETSCTPCTEDSQTQFLDAQGFLRMDKRPSTHSLLKTSAICTQGEPSDELLNLCSGSFGAQETSKNVGSHSLPHIKALSGLLSSRRNPDEGGTQGTDILELCSGIFPSSQNGTEEECRDVDGVKGKGDSDVVERWAMRHSQLPNNKQEEGEESEDEDMPLLLKRRTSLPKPKPTASERLQEFVESEAELSGEDVGPEEEEEDRDGPDEYEEEEGAELEPGLSETELKNQVTRVHTKYTLADDKAELLELQERYLKEGDLYEDGLALRNGFFRTRRYGPAGSEGSMDLFAEDRNLDTEVDMQEDNSQAEVLRRKDKLEREEFVRKCREREGSLLEIDEDSQSILNIIRDTSSHSLLSTPTSSKPLDEPATSSVKKSRGSFLKHDSATLRRLSSITAATPSISKAFVFHKSTPVNNDTPTHSSRTKSGSSGSKSKRPKLDNPAPLPNSDNSVFSLLK